VLAQERGGDRGAAPPRHRRDGTAAPSPHGDPGPGRHEPSGEPRRLVRVRAEDNLWRSARGTAHQRLTGGFRKSRAPRFLPSGRLVCLWSEGKQHGIDRLDADGKNRETVWQGPIYYRTITPSPDGRFFAATFTYDLAFHPSDALKLRQTEELRLLDERGWPLAILERSGRYHNHSPDWGR
jgi:hypothetical protein